MLHSYETDERSFIKTEYGYFKIIFETFERTLY